MTEAKKLVDQLKPIYTGDAWHGSSFREIFSDISAAKAAAKPLPSAHSIWEITLHIAAWESAVLRRTKDDPANLTDAEDWPPVNGTNVGRGRPATASSAQAPLNGATFDPGNAVDGNLSTRWATDWSDPQWIRVDLGQSTTIRHVQLIWESAYGRAYQLQVSADGTNWTTVYSTGNGDGGVDDIDLTGTGRYVRLYGTARGTTYGYSLYEFGIYS